MNTFFCRIFASDYIKDTWQVIEKTRPDLLNDSKIRMQIKSNKLRRKRRKEQRETIQLCTKFALLKVVIAHKLSFYSLLVFYCFKFTHLLARSSKNKREREISFMFFFLLLLLVFIVSFQSYLAIKLNNKCLNLKIKYYYFSLSFFFLFLGLFVELKWSATKLSNFKSFIISSNHSKPSAE